MLIASQGLFDSMYLDDVVDAISRWEHENSNVRAKKHDFIVHALQWLKSISLPSDSYQFIFELLMGFLPCENVIESENLNPRLYNKSLAVEVVRTCEAIAKASDGCLKLFQSLSDAIVNSGKKSQVDKSKLYEKLSANAVKLWSENILEGLQSAPKSLSAVSTCNDLSCLYSV